MFDSNLWNEVLQTISMRRRQSLMTAFGVFWGILMLTVLLGIGRGLDDGIISKLTSLPPNELFVHPTQTSMPYRGFGRDRTWLLNSHDEELVRHYYGYGLMFYSACCFAGYQNVTKGEQTYQYQVTGVDPQFVNFLPQRVIAGRFINELDMREHRKVCVIGERVAEMLFDDNEEAIGSIIEVNGMSLELVGVTHCTNRHVRIGIDVSESVFMPLPTEQTAYGRGDDIDLCSIVMFDDFPMEQHQERILGLIRENHSIHPDDELAMIASTVSQQTAMYDNLIIANKILIWIVGLGTLMAGLIGISNIMLVSVRERTQEIGIRRAIGAKPLDILKQIMLESIVLTLTAGLAGLCVAVWLLYMVGRMLPQGDDAVFAQPTMPFWLAIISLLILVAGGMLAGWIPAKRALAIKPIDALREED